MKHLLTLVFCIIAGIHVYGKTWTITTTNQNRFEPATLIVSIYDTIVFDVPDEVIVTEVNEEDWLAGLNTLLPGGFIIYGPGVILPAELETGIHWYVNAPLSEQGMRGSITVEHTTHTESITPSVSFTVSPNPGRGKFQIAVDPLSPYEKFTVSVSALNGEIIYKTRDANKFEEIDLTGIQHGFYLVTIATGSRLQTRKLLIQ